MENNIDFLSFIGKRPKAQASLKGSRDYPNIRGLVQFYQTNSGVVVVSRVWGLPKSPYACREPIFAFHIHSGASCSGNKEDYFADAMTHYNPNSCPHPYHAGDMPPLFGCDGVAFSAFMTDRFVVSEVIGKTVIVHSAPDDFTTQPAGNSGQKIACGVIEKNFF